MTPRPPLSRETGCLLCSFGVLLVFVGGAMAVVVGLLVFGGQLPNNGPERLVLLLPLVLLAVGGVALRYGLPAVRRPRPPVPVNPAEQAMARAAAPSAVGYFVVTVLSMGGVIVAQFAFNAPQWVIPIIFFGPPVIFTVLVRPIMRRLPGQVARATPSPERQAAEATAPPPEPEPEFGERPDTLADEPGTGRVLAYALDHAGASPVLGCVGMLAVALFWNGIVSVFVWQVVTAVRNGQPDWCLTVFLIPFVLIGLTLAGGTVLAGYIWVLSLLVGRLRVEVSAHPLYPGGRFALHVGQRGPVPLTRVAVELVCTEAATYTAGTSQSTDTKVAARHTAGDWAGGLPATVEVEAPADAMHTFTATKNEIRWTVRVAGRVFGLPYHDEFRVTVGPGVPAAAPWPRLNDEVAPDARLAAAPVGQRPDDLVHIALGDSEYRPGDELAGVFVIPDELPADTTSVELSVLWHTSGKGTEDLGVIHYQGWTAADGTLEDRPNPCPFAVRLPPVPWTYDGVLVKIHWLVRVRVRFGRTGEVVREVPFTLSPGGRP